jgi:CheY-like chemotaxis protein
MNHDLSSLSALLATDNRATMQLMRHAVGMMGFRDYEDCLTVRDLMRHIDRLVLGNRRFILLISTFDEQEEISIIAQIRAHAKPPVTSCPIIAIAPIGNPKMGADAHRVGASEVVFEPFSISDILAAVSSALQNEAPPLAAIDVMVVEDVDSNRAIIRHLLKELPARRIVEATDGLAALKMLTAMSAKGQFPHILIVDYMMEPMDGLSLVREIRSSEKLANPQVPILMLTFKGNRETVTASQLAGADGFIVKPVSGPTFIRRIRRALAATKTRPRLATDGRRSGLMDAHRLAYGTGPGFAMQECDPEALTSGMLRDTYATWKSAAGKLPMPTMDATLQMSHLFLESANLIVTIRPPGTIEFATVNEEFTGLGIVQGQALAELVHVRSRILVVRPVKDVLSRGEPVARILIPPRAEGAKIENRQTSDRQEQNSDRYEAVFLPFGNAPKIEIIYGIFWSSPMLASS